MAENSLERSVLNEEMVDKSGLTLNGVTTDAKCDANDGNNTIAIGRKISIRSNKKIKVRNRWAIERSNYVNLMKLIVKELIEKSAKTNRIVESNNISLKHLFGGLFESRKDLWNVIEIVERLSSDASDITVSARQIPTIKTHLGRVRAWMRLALMNKRLSDYFRLLLENREIILKDYYEEMSIMMSDEAVIIGGLLVGLNILDCNLFVKEENLDSDDTITSKRIHLNPNGGIITRPTMNDNISVVLDQKNYIEELNRHLSSTISNLEHKIETLQTDNTLMSEELEVYRNVDKNFEIIKTIPEMDSIKQSKEEFSQLEEQLKQEVKRRELAEKELESQLFLKGECETAMHLLERDVLEKQDSVITLRRQLEDIKTINLQMYSKLQECETSIKNKVNHISHLEQNISTMANTISQLESKVTNYEKLRANDEQNQMKLSEQLTDNNKLKILNQVKLPLTVEFEDINNVTDAWNAIHSMKVRGAPAIAILAVLSIAVELNDQQIIGEVNGDKDKLLDQLRQKCQYLCTSRPTAVNIDKECKHLVEVSAKLAADSNISFDSMIKQLTEYSVNLLQIDINVNKSIGDFGAQYIKQLTKKDVNNILTHCNTGSLATAGYGTALGVIRSLHSTKSLSHAYCTETRPYNQGSRLTAWELLRDNIPSTLICDSMVAALFKDKTIDAVVVGADRVVANGDTANKIGTYQIAVLAKYHSVPFFVASPQSTIDMTRKTGDDIPIEERPGDEMKKVAGIQITAPEINCWNPSFDVTPNELITGIITEFGVFAPNQLQTKFVAEYRSRSIPFFGRQRMVWSTDGIRQRPYHSSKRPLLVFRDALDFLKSGSPFLLSLGVPLGSDSLALNVCQLFA
ncbi:unnamed protein product, partial [Medioppia subpectinata]